MKINWSEFVGMTLHVTLKENYGMVIDPHTETALYEIVYKTGKLSAAYEEGLLLETVREEHQVKIFIPYDSIKCVEFFQV